MVTPSSILAWRIPWTKETGRLRSIGSQRVRQNLVIKHTQTNSILDLLKKKKKRTVYSIFGGLGGQTINVIKYANTKERLSNKFGSPNPGTLFEVSEYNNQVKDPAIWQKTDLFSFV